MGGPVKGKRLQVRHRKGGSSSADPASQHLTPQHGRHLQIDQLGGGQVLVSQSGAGHNPVRPVVGQRDDEHAGLNDQHARGATFRRPH